MARNKIQRKDVLKIAKKIGATLEEGGSHKLAIFRHEGKLILTFGIRHGSKSGHGHLVGEHGPLKLNAAKVSALAECTLSRDQYIEILQDRGIIERNAPAQL